MDDGNLAKYRIIGRASNGAASCYGDASTRAPHGNSFDLIRQEIDSVYQLMAEGVETSSPNQRVYFQLGLRSGLDSTIDLANAVAGIMAAKGHNNPSDG